MLRRMCGGHKYWQNEERKNESDNESGKNVKESAGKEITVVRTCNEKRRGICG